jgi:putative methionine-R-sulfoxide reductase with GAF domain
VIFLDYFLAEQKILEIINHKNSKFLTEVVDFLYENFDQYSWVGLYLVEGNDLVLGPWKGEQATEHTRIPIGQGICGSAAVSGKTEVISDVNADKRYLACFISTKSEIVVPIKKEGKILGEIDIDSDIKDAFKKEDADFLEKIADMLSKHI